MKHAFLAAALSFTLAAAACWAADASPKGDPKASSAVVSKLITTTYGGPNLHRVSSDGKIVPFKLPAGTRWGSGAAEGSDDPLVSPDGKLIAFVQKGSLLIRPMEGGKSTTVVSGYLHETLLMTAWSPDSTLLIYHLGPSQADDAPPSKITEPQSFVYDLKSATSRKIKIKGAFCGWLPDGTMLVHDPEAGTLSSAPVGSGIKAKVLRSDAAGFGQIALSPDGKQIALSKYKPNDTSSSQLVIIDLASSKVTPLSKPGSWAEYQWPKWSPSGKRMAWLTQTVMVGGRPKSVLVVDGKAITKETELFEQVWLTDDVLALVEEDALVVVNADNGKELGRKVLPKTAE